MQNESSYARLVKLKDSISQLISSLDAEVGGVQAAETIVALCREQGLLVVGPKDLQVSELDDLIQPDPREAFPEDPTDDEVPF